DSLYIVAMGRLAVLAPGTTDQVITQVLHGNVLGELPMALELPCRTATVVAKSDSWLIRIMYDDITAFLQRHPSLYQAFKINLVKLAASHS
ncbi:MAG: cyclic nucleotide-binding domain-containing protein, partial [Cyanobacteria bacterium REEB65]|nr:cyclic nucleotide-binding domain-containing protein [Cyanobacteria bacterium REEB65]